jgi:hypothetical protein
MIISLPISYFLFSVGSPPYYLLVGYLFTSILNTCVGVFLLKKILNFDINFLIKNSYLRVLYIIIFTLPLFFLNNYFESTLERFIFFSFGSIFYLILIIYQIGLDKTEKLFFINFFYSLKKNKKI